ncbi:transcriptional regulator, GntR-family [Bordetella petrii]|uniref:Transcriptional regulator, GntR-family n=1 Tax=Bordetella petrii (strain ATCC BAA-461 / DSM 12804 / CCUG 43448 / CIP 107267 / Se-1111R) TaxID=340100 RepID=A9I3B6_BORPD|nr:transcriptional regulator, GntR-family [Bordetella petrii]
MARPRAAVPKAALLFGDPVSAASDSTVDRVYNQLRSMAIGYEFKPGEKLNEVALAKRMEVSRTPLREALNRLGIEGLLRFQPGKGFFCRDLDVHEIFNLYELRKTVEIAGARLSMTRARDEDLRKLLEFLDATGPEPGDRSVAELVDLDESFHETLLALSGNTEMLRVLRNINARIRFVRWIDMRLGDRRNSQLEHRRIVEALLARDETACVGLLEKHIERRLDQVTSAIREGYAQIYMGAQAQAAAA